MKILAKRKWLTYVLIIIGTWLMGLAVNVVYEPMNMVTGGVAGLAIILKNLTENLMEGGIPVWLTTACVNVPLFLVAVKLKGKKFIGKTLFATVSYTVALYVIPRVPIVSEDYLLAAVFGGVISGLGLGMVFATGTSTGGSDLFGSIMQVYFKHYSVAQLLLITDGIIVLMGAAVFGMYRALYAVIAVFITSKIMDGILEGLKFAKLAYIISEEQEKISAEILHVMVRGVTAIPVKGMYSKKEKSMLLCVVSKKEIVKLTELVENIDANAFVIISDVREVMGEGFIEYRQY